MNRFDLAAAGWDNLPRRVTLAAAVVETVIREAAPEPWMQLLDFGAGTGLVTLGLHHLVRGVIACDSSSGMLEQLEYKLAGSGISNVVTVQTAATEPPELPAGIDLLVCSMTMHHIREPLQLLRCFCSSLNRGGKVCVADLQREDGSFHDNRSEDIHHHGFMIEDMERYFTEAGFLAVRTVPVTSIVKERGGVEYSYQVNMTIGER